VFLDLSKFAKLNTLSPMFAAVSLTLRNSQNRPETRSGGTSDQKVAGSSLAGCTISKRILDVTI
jgi:hypothetical protein